MNELRDELIAEGNKGRARLFSREALRLGLLFVMILASAIYVGNLLFGQNSYSTILSLEDQRDSLNKDIEMLKTQNAKYQKEYFELKRIGGEK